MDDKVLRNLKADLSRQKAEVRSRIVLTINAHYERYQAAIKALQDTPKWLQDTREPLRALQDDAASLADTATAESGAYSAKLAQLERIRHHKKLLEFFLDAHRKVEWLERLVGIDFAAAQSEAAAAASRNPRTNRRVSTATVIPDTERLYVRDPAQLERVSLFLSLLRASVEPAAAQYAFLANLAPRLDVVRTICQRSAHALLTAQLDEFRAGRAGDVPTVHACARAYLYLDAWSQLVVGYITGLVDPVLLAARDVAGAGSGGKRQIPVYLRTVERELSKAPLTLLRHLRDVAPPAERELLSRHVLLRLLEGLEGGTTPATFSAAVPTAFHRNYVATVTFFRSMLDELGLADQLAAIPELHEFMRKWPVETYFQLIARQVTADLEPRADAGPAVIAALDRMHADFLPALVHRFYKLAAQLALRHHLALTTAPVTSCAHALQRLAGLGETHRAILASPLVAQHPSIAAGLAPLLAKGGDPLVRAWRAYLATELAEGCATVLRLTKTVASQYRATGRAAPTEASSFMPLAFKHVAELMATDDARALAEVEEGGDAVWRDVVPAVVQSATDTYLGIVTELLTTLKKTEESLKRLKMAKARHAGGGAVATTGGAAAVTDEDKIRMQIALDTEAFAAEIARLPHMDADAVERYVAPIRALLLEHRPGDSSWADESSST
ncbi:Conserved oligomeric Golgi complex subunit 2 [Blastocladiella emersonii ATCC 22665]|nr:Conserved oligomeric Golgi complex subunit 2 [Blastocladiella emersonii ATCC 22665]